MALGPGKYDHLCTYVRTQANAPGAVVIIFAPDGRSGFSVQATPEMQLAMPRILRDIADQVDADIAAALAALRS